MKCMGQHGSMSKHVKSSIPGENDRKVRLVRESGLQHLGLKPRYLQKDRLFGPKIPYYRHGRMILYDLSEVEAIVKAGRVEVSQ